MDHLSSLPLKKRPLRNDFTCIEDLATSHMQSLMCASDTEISSSGRSSSASSIEMEKEPPLGHHHFSPPLRHALYCAGSPFTLICHPSELERTNRTMPFGRKDEVGTKLESSSASLGMEIDDFNCVAVDGPRMGVVSSINSSSSASTSSFTTNHSSNCSSLVYCSSCDKNFTGRAKYQAHIRRHNSKLTGRYQCTDCGKRFVQRSSLVTHLRIHTGERPYKCAFRSCSESFSDFSTYTKHIRTHTGEKPYSCPICFRAFSQSGNMHRHLKGVHKQIGHPKSSNSILTVKSG